MYDDARSSLDHALHEYEYYGNDRYVAQVLQSSADLSMAIEQTTMEHLPLLDALWRNVG